MKEKHYKVSCLNCDYADEALYPYQKKAVREMARHHARHFKHTMKETETIINTYKPPNPKPPNPQRGNNNKL